MIRMFRFCLSSKRYGANHILSTASREEGIASTMTRSEQGSENFRLDGVKPFETEVRIGAQSVFYALRALDGTCESGCGDSQIHVAEIVFGVEIVEWDLCSVCLSRTGFLEYFNSLPSATSREAEEVKILLGISNRTFESQNRTALHAT
jgi:hypothetical protein